MNSHIEIESFNPYETKFPNRKLITRDTLKLIKVLRQQGVDVIVTPKNNLPVQYLFRKGISSFLSDPVNSFLVGLPTGLIINILSNYIQKMLDGKPSKEILKIQNNITINQTTTNITYNLNDKKISASEMKDRKLKRKKLKDEFDKCLNLSSPYIYLPTPIFLEHKPRIIGWASINMNDKGLLIEDSHILDKDVFRKIEQGKIKGASVTGIAEKAICSICNSNYVECIHISGEVYNSHECVNSLVKTTAIEMSFVKTPTNAECLINIKR